MKPSIGRSRWTLALAGALVLGAAAARAWAAADPSVGTAGDLEHAGLATFFQHGGVAMWAILLLSVGALAAVVYDAATLRLAQIAPAALRDDVMGKLQEKQWEDARTACSYRPCGFSAMVLAALDLAEAQGTADPVLLKDTIEGEGARQATQIQEQPQLLLDIAVLSPMVGLLGSIFGMMAAFRAVASDAAKAKPYLLAGGVAEAMYATAGGLVVGILAMACYGYFRRRASRLVGELEGAGSELFTTLVRAKRA